MFLRSFVKNNLLFRIMDPLKRKSPFKIVLLFLKVITINAWKDNPE